MMETQNPARHVRQPGMAKPVAEFQGYIGGEPVVHWLDRSNMPPGGTRLFTAPIGSDDLLEVVRALCAVAARAARATPERREHYPHADQEGSPVLAAARAACLARGYTEDGLAVAGVIYPVTNREAQPDGLPALPEFQAPSNFSSKQMRDYASQAIAADRASRQPAPAATTGASTAEHEEILGLHRQLAAEKLRADQGWQRAEAKSRECLDLRARMAGSVGASTVLTDERIWEIARETIPTIRIRPIVDFARAIVREVAAQAGQVYLAAELEPAEPVYKVADLKSAQAFTPGERQEGGA